MVILRPFRALRYNPALVPDMSAVVAPPYDVISETYRDVLHERSPYNVIHLILNRAADRYAAAAANLRAWRQDGVLVRDAEPSLCFYVEDFTLKDGSSHRREGIIGIARLEPFSSGNIRPHERTFARAKEDRMQILRACRTNLSPIFGLFADGSGALDPVRKAAQHRPADLDLRDDAGVRHQLWLLKEPAVIAAMAEMLAAQTVFIADGHHRYETALAYRDSRSAEGNVDPEAACNFILMYLTSMEHPGLVILPTHRVLSGATGLAAAEILARLRRAFRLTPFARSAQDAFLASLRNASQAGRFGVVLADCDELFVATLEDARELDRYAAGAAPVVRQLDVTVLDAVILRGLLDDLRARVA